MEATGNSTKIVSVEKDSVRAAATQTLFAEYPNVTVLHGDWRQIADRGPFELLILDGGGGGKRENDPPLAYWPEEDAPRDQFGRSVTKARAYWLQHPDLFASEVRFHPEMSVILGTGKAPRG